MPAGSGVINHNTRSVASNAIGDTSLLDVNSGRPFLDPLLISVNLRGTSSACSNMNYEFQSDLHGVATF